LNKYKDWLSWPPNLAEFAALGSDAVKKGNLPMDAIGRINPLMVELFGKAAVNAIANDKGMTEVFGMALAQYCQN